MAKLAQIGNSQGVRIPKPIIEQAKLENTEIEFVVVKDGLLLKPIRTKARKSWKQSILDAHEKNVTSIDDGVLTELLDDSDLDVWEW